VDGPGACVICWPVPAFPCCGFLGSGLGGRVDRRSLSGAGSDLKSAQCRFESDWGHPESAGRGDFDGPHHGSEAASVSPNVITTRLKLVAAALRASSWLWAYTAIVNAALACPSEGAIVAIGTLRACIDDAQLCRAS